MDENGAAILLKNNPPRYDLIEFSQFQEEEVIGDDAVDAFAKRILKKHQPLLRNWPNEAVEPPHQQVLR